MTATFLFSDQDDFNSISDRREARERLERLAWAMDSAIRVPGTNFTIGADAMLGLVPVKPRGSGKTRKAEAGPLRLKQVDSVAADRFGRQLDEVRNLEQLVAVVKEFDAERRRLRAVLERIVTMIDEALG